MKEFTFIISKDKLTSVLKKAYLSGWHGSLDLAESSAEELAEECTKEIVSNRDYRAVPESDDEQPIASRRILPKKSLGYSKIVSQKPERFNTNSYLSAEDYVDYFKSAHDYIEYGEMPGISKEENQ